MTQQHSYMQQALALARRGEGRTAPNPPVGAVLVKADQVVGEGFHPRAGEPHAEIFALRQAGAEARGATLYVTLEPCCHQGRTGPCCEAVIAAGVARVVVGCQDPNPQVAGQGLARLRAAGLEVELSDCAECRRLIAPFAKHITTGRPLVILKLATTLDGRVATATGESQWITSEQSRARVHQLRDRVDAILVGSGTVRQDDPRLTTRLPAGGRDPLRVVIDSQLSSPLEARVFNPAPPGTLLATTSVAPPDKLAALRERGVEIVVLDGPDGRVALPTLLDALGRRGVQSLLVEGGGRLNHAFWSARLVDRLMLFVAPRLIGGDDAPGMFAGAGVSRLADAMELADLQVERIGPDLLIEGEVPCSPA